MNDAEVEGPVWNSFRGRIGPNGRELVEEFAGEIEASQALEAVAQAKRRRRHRDL